MQNDNISPTSQHIAKNTSFLTVAYIFQKVFAFIYFTLVARWIGPEDVGKYVFAVSLTTILSIFIDLGLSPVLIKETAKFKEKANKYLNNIITIKLILALFAYSTTIIIINLVNKDPLTTLMVYLAGLVMIFDSFSLSFWGVFRGYQNLKYEAIAITINQIIILSVGLGGIILKFPIYVLVLALLAGSFFTFCFSLFLIKTKLQYKFKLELSKDTLKLLFKIALPFALAGIFTRVYSYIDQVLLSVLIGDETLGWYSVPYKITFALQFIPMAFAASIFPAMSNYFQYDKQKLKNLFEKSMYFLMIISVPITFGVIFISRDLITTLYTANFINSILPLQILIVALIAIFLSFPVGSLLNSCNKQHINTINLGITMLINIVLNLILIPRLQHVGAAIAATVSLYYLFFANLYFVKFIIRYDYKYLWKKFLTSLISSILMGIIVYYINAQTNFVIAIIFGVISYSLFMFLFKGIKKEEISFITQAVIKK